MKSELMLLSLLLLTSACQKEESPYQISGTAMTMEYHVLVGDTLTHADKRKIGGIIQQVFGEVDTVLNNWNPHSELSALNQTEAHIKIALSPLLSLFLHETDKMVKLTQGRFDPTVGPLKKLWIENLKQGKRPSEEALGKQKKALGWKHVHLEKDIFWKDAPGVEIDVGGIAKGYCVDRIVEKLQEAGYHNLLVEWAGEMRASGHHPEGRAWHVFISRLGSPDPKKAIATLPLNDEAVATSGTYFQRWTIVEGGVTTTYTHIFDPATGFPLVCGEERLSSVTIVAPTCLVADALTKAAFVLGDEKKAASWLENVKKQIPTLQFWLVSSRVKV